MLAHNPKKRIFFNVVSLFLIAMIALFVGCGDIEYGPRYIFSAQFKTNKELCDFYQIFKKQNAYQAISFDLDDNELFDLKLYTFYGGPFDHSKITSDNQYDYEYEAPSFEFWFSYIDEAIATLNNRQETNSEKVFIKCEQVFNDYNLNISLTELKYSLFSSYLRYENVPEELNRNTKLNVYEYHAYLGDKNVFSIKIMFEDGSVNATEEYANNVLEVLKQNMVILK